MPISGLISQAMVTLFQLWILHETIRNLNVAAKREENIILKLKELNAEFFKLLKQHRKLPGDEWMDQ